MKGVVRLVLTLVLVLGAEAAFFARVGIPDRPELLAAPQIALSLSALLIVLRWSSTRLPSPAEAPRWPSRTSDLPHVDPEWDLLTGRLATMFIRRRWATVFTPDALAVTLTTLLREHSLLEASDLPGDLRAFVDAPRGMPSTKTLHRWLDWVEAHR